MTVIRDDVLEPISDGRLKVFVIWEPILPKDAEDALDDAGALLKDEWRATQYWDPARTSGNAIKQLLGLGIPNPAWDVYLLYAPGKKWTDGPPKPDFWMHQLTFKPGSSDVANFESRRLDTKRFRAEIEKRLTSPSRRSFQTRPIAWRSPRPSRRRSESQSGSGNAMTLRVRATHFHPSPSKTPYVQMD